MQKKLILVSENETMIAQNNDLCDVKFYYKNNKINNLLLRVISKFKLFFLVGPILFSWKKDIKKYKTIILFDFGYYSAISHYIKRKNKNCRLILWIWNPCNDFIFKKYGADKCIDEFWTYDKAGSEKYGFSYNTQFYNKEFNIKENNVKYDVVFLGFNKNREKIINDCKKKFEKNNVKCNFKIIYDIKDLLTYDEYLNFLSEGNVILDIVSDNVTGLTLRILESIFFHKKVITNNASIVNYEFYNKNNFFIINKDDINNLKKFVKSDYDLSNNQKYVDYYDFKSWLDRFDSKEK